MGLIASIAHGFKHCRKRASGYHPLYKEACHIQDVLRELKFNWIRKDRHLKRLDWNTFRRFHQWELS